MSKEARSVISSREQRQLWAEEYSSITQRLATSTARVWNVMSIFVGGSIAAAAVFLLKESHGFSSFVSAYVIGAGIVVILWISLDWFVRRERWHKYILYGRQRQLEKRLNFYAGRFIHELDEKNREEKWSGEYGDFPPYEKGLLAYLDWKYVHLPTKGWDFMTWAVRITMLIWAVVVARQFVQWLLCSLDAYTLSEMWHDWRLPLAVVLLVVPALVIGVRALVVAACALWRTGITSPVVAARALVAGACALWRVGAPSCSIERERKPKERED